MYGGLTMRESVVYARNHAKRGKRYLWTANNVLSALAEADGDDYRDDATIEWFIWATNGLPAKAKMGAWKDLSQRDRFKTLEARSTAFENALRKERDIFHEGVPISELELD